MSGCDLATATDIKCGVTNSASHRLGGFFCDAAVGVKGHGGRKCLRHHNEICPLASCDAQIGLHSRRRVRLI